MNANAPPAAPATRAAKKTVDAGIIVKLTLFVPYVRGNLDSLSTAVSKAKDLSTVDGLKKIADGVEIVKAETKEGTRPTD